MEQDLKILKASIISRLKLCGFMVRSDSIIYLTKELFPLSAKDRKYWLQSITSNIQAQGLSSPNIEKHHVELAVKEVKYEGVLEDDESIFNVISAFDVPHFVYNEEKRKFEKETSERQFLPPGQMKSYYLRERYQLLWQRTTRHELFAAKSIMGEETKMKLKKIENLLSVSKMNQVILLALIVQLTEGKYYLEDPTGIIAIDLSEASYSSGLFCEGSFVIVSGTYRDEVLKIKEVSSPASELAKSSLSYFGSANFWGGPSETLLKYSEKLKDIELTTTNDSIIFLADCWLDDPLVMERLHLMFRGFQEYPPAAFVFMGPFMKDYSKKYELQEKLKLLGEMFESFRNINNQTHLVLVPSVEDPGGINILPRPEIPELFTTEIRRSVKRLSLATNPCRIQYCTQQIVIFRCDLLTKLCRNSIHFPTEGSLEDHFTRTLICQATLAPLTSNALPIYWNYDSALNLYPLPDLVVIGDPCKSFFKTEQECTVLNTGSFPKSNFSFSVYEPSSRTIEESQIPEEGVLDLI